MSRKLGGSCEALRCDNVGIASVQFTFNGVALGPTDTAAPYTIDWDTTNVANGVHTLGAVAYDATGNHTS